MIHNKEIALLEKRESALQKYHSYGNEWEKVYFDEISGGYVVQHVGHKLDPDTGRFELQTVTLLAKRGYSVEMVNESGFSQPQYDITINGVPSEIKVMNGFRNIHKRAVKAAKQGAKRIIFYINFNNDFEMHNRFNNVYKTIKFINEIWFIKNEELHFYFRK